MALTKISTAMISQSAAAVDLNVDAGTFYVDTTNNRVGVGGKTDPDTPLHVVGTVTATLFAGSGASLTNIPNSALTNSSITINSTATSLGGSITLGTDDVAEGSSNLYYTNARADARIAAADTDDLSEGSSNLYYTDARVDARISGGSLGNITTTGYIRGPSSFTIDPAAHGDNTGTVVIAGNLQVDGVTTTINSTTLTVDDKNITLASGSANAAAANGAGFTVDIGSGTNPTITYDGTNDEWDFNKALNVTGNIVASGNVGIGTASPNAYSNQTTLTINGATYGRIDLESGGIVRTSLFSQAANTSLSVDSGFFTIDCGGSERMRLDTSGNFLLGTTSTTVGAAGSGTTGFRVDSANGIVQAASDGTTAAIFNRTSNNGDVIDLRRDGTTVGSISVNGGYLGVGAGAVYLGYYTSGSTKSIIPMGNATGGAAAGTIDLGLNLANHKFKDLHLAGTANVGGNVGIGTASPNTNVQIYHATDDVSINVNHGTGGSYPKKSGISFGATSTSLGGDATFTGGAGIQAINTAASNNPTEMAFFTTSGGSPTERMRIDSLGNVGIGTTDPFTTGGASKLTVAGILSFGLSNADMSYIRRQSTGNYAWQTYDNNNTGSIQLQPYGGNVGIGTTAPGRALEVSTDGTAQFRLSRVDSTINGNNTIGTIEFWGTDDTSGTIGATIVAHAASTWGGGAYPTDLRFSTMDGSTLSEQMRITRLGDISIGSDHGGFNGWKVLNIRQNSTGGMVNFEEDDGTRAFTFANQGVGMRYQAHITGGYHRFETHALGAGTAMMITDAGNVGIGTTSPASNLHIKTSVDNSVAQGLVIERSANTDRGYINYNGGGFQFRSTVGDPIVFGETDAEHMRILPDGNVGIGTASPSANLEITQSGNNVGLLVAGGGYNYTAKFESVDAEANIIIEDNNSTNDGNMIGVATNDMYFITDTAERLRIDSNGNVGINRTSISQPSGGATTLAIQGTDNNKAGAIRLYSANDSVHAYIYPDSVNGLSINTSTSHPMVFRTAATERMRIMSDGQIRIGSGSAQRPIIQATNWGYSASYRVALLGSASNAYNTQGTGSVTLAMNYDPSGNSDGSFGGDGREILFRNSTQFVTPNDADNDFNLYNLVLKDGTVGIGTSNPTSALSVRGAGSGGSQKNTISFGTSGWGSPTAPNAALDGAVKLALFEGGTQKVQIGMDANARLWLASAGSGAQGVDIYTGASNTAAPTLRFRVDQGGTTNIYGNLAVSSTTSTDVAVVHASGVDTSASMGGQSPKLTVAGYTSLDGLRIAGGDSGNTIYKSGSALSVVSSTHAVNVKGNTQVNLQAGSNEMFRAAVNKWSLGGGSYGHGRIRSYHHVVSLSANATIALLQNQSAHTDVNFIYWIEAFHSSRSYRTGMGTFGGYGMHKSSASNGGLDIYGTNISSGIQRLDIQANSSYATSYHISMLIFGDSGITVHNGTMSDQI